MLFIRQKKIKQTLKRALLFLGALYFLVGAFLFFFQEKILFVPSVLPQDYKYEFAHNFEELFLNTDEKAVVNALHFKVENPKGVVLYFHGNAGDLSRWGKTTEYFADKDYDVLVMDYRTFGKSTGALSEPALYSDAQFCYDYLKDRYSEAKIRFEKTQMELAEFNDRNQNVITARAQTEYQKLQNEYNLTFEVYKNVKVI